MKRSNFEYFASREVEMRHCKDTCQVLNIRQHKESDTGKKSVYKVVSAQIVQKFFIIRKPNFWRKFYERRAEF